MSFVHKSVVRERVFEAVDMLDEMVSRLKKGRRDYPWRITGHALEIIHRALEGNMQFDSLLAKKNQAIDKIVMVDKSISMQGLAEMTEWLEAIREIMNVDNS